MTNEFNEKAGEKILGGAHPDAVSEFNKPTEDDEVTAEELENVFAGLGSIKLGEKVNLEKPENYRPQQVSNVQAAEDEQGRKGR